MPTINFLTLGTETPAWLYSLGIESGQRYWLPGIFAAPGNPVLFVKRKSSHFATRSIELRLADMAERDGIERIRHLNHLFLPYSWIVSVKSEAREFCGAAVRRFQMHGQQIA